MEGVIYKIERLAVYDGPGIRTVIFLKGCPLACVWCSSPESQKLIPEIGFWQEKCVACGACVDVCRSKAIGKDKNRNILQHFEACTNNGDCVRACLYQARKMIGGKVTVDEVVTELEKDAVFYHRSEGGVTLSGGDPICQPLFSARILERAVQMGFHTAVETSAYGDWPAFAGILDHLDLVYVDVKHMDMSAHKALTGKGNQRILDNIQRLDKQYPDLDLILRIPVIPGKNDSKDNIQKTGQFAAGLKTLKRIELLPYHRYGVSTYFVIGRSYALNEIDSPSREQVERLKAVLVSQGIFDVRIGG